MAVTTLGDVVINLRGQDINLASTLDEGKRNVDGFNSSLGGVTGELSKIKDQLFSVQGVMRIVFGYQVFRTMFREIHEGAINATEGFFQARDAGMSFGDAMENAAQKALGLKTNVEVLNEHLKTTKELGKTFAELQDKTAKMGEEKTGDYPDVPHADDIVKDWKAEVNKARDEMQKAYAELHNFGEQRQSKVQQALDQMNRAPWWTKLFGPIGAAAGGAATPLQTEDERKDKQQQYQNAKAAFDIISNKAADAKAESHEKEMAIKGEEQLHDVLKDAARAVEQWKDNLKASIISLRDKNREELEASKKDDERQKQIREIDARMADLIKEQFIKAENQAKEIRDISDPLAKIKDEANKAQDLFLTGHLTGPERDKYFKHLEDDSKFHQKATFKSTEDFAKSIQEGLDSKKEVTLPTLKDIHQALLDILTLPLPNPLGGMAP